MLLAAASFLGGAGTGWPLMQHIGFALGGLNLISLALVAAGGRGLDTSTSADRTRLTAGETSEESCRIEKRGFWPAVWLEVEWSDGETQNTAVRGGGTRLLTHRRIYPMRGRYVAADAIVRVRDPLGLFRRCCSTLPGSAITVYPRPVASPEALAAVHALSASQHRWRLGAADGTLGDLRDYVAGDAPSRIHWRTTARRGVLTVTDPESQRRQSIWLLVDLGGSEEAAERNAGIAAYLAERLHAAGNSVGAVVAGDRVAVVPARRGREGAAQILSALAEVGDAIRPQIELLLRAAAQAPDPGCFVLVSSLGSPGREDPVRRLRASHPRVQVLRVMAGESAA
jgi:uncharacterized protein (DUF58 family)